MSEETITEKRKSINLLRSYVYHYKTIDQSNQIHIITDKENVLRYVIRTVEQTDDEDIDEENFVLI